MYAIIRAGGKQAKVREGDVIDVERIKATDSVTYTPLLIVTEDGTVISSRADLAKASVVAEVIGDSKGPKVEIFKYKNKTGYRRRQGHRQRYTTIQVKKIQAPGAAPKKKATKAEPAPAVEDRTEEAASAEEE